MCPTFWDIFLWKGEGKTSVVAQEHLKREQSSGVPPLYANEDPGLEEKNLRGLKSKQKSTVVHITYPSKTDYFDQLAGMAEISAKICKWAKTSSSHL